MTVRVAARGTRASRASRVRLVAVVGALVLASAACGGDETASGDGDVSIGLVTKTETNPFFVQMREAATTVAEEQGVELTALAATTRARWPPSRT